VLSINLEECNKCGICSAVCPACIINTDNGWPELQTDKESLCIRCGQCFVHCPQGSINIDFSNAREFSGAIGEPLTLEQIGYYIANRRSVRCFKKEQVPRETIEKLLDIVRYAPTAKNAQNVKWVIVSSKDKLNEILDLTARYLEDRAAKSYDPLEIEYLSYLLSERKKGRDLILWDAPHLALAYERNRGIKSINGVIAATCFMMAAPAIGLGTCWAGYLQMATSSTSQFNEVLQIPEGNLITGALMFGYPQYKTYRIPQRKAARVLWL